VAVHREIAARLMHWTRRLASVMDRLPDRLAHGSRRQSSLRRLRAGPEARRFLVVCHANLCRSPYAAAALRRALAARGDQAEIRSCGFAQPSLTVPAEALAAATHRDIDLRGHRPALLDMSDVERADVVIVMDRGAAAALAARRHLATPPFVLGDFDPRPMTTSTIDDPVGGPRAGYDACYARIDRCIDALVRALPDRPGTAGPPVLLPALPEDHHRNRH
jgi:protein-tyrosine phosphatase